MAYILGFRGWAPLGCLAQMGATVARFANPLRDWRVKSLLQKAMSATGRGAELNFLFQRYVAHSLPVADAYLRQAVAGVAEHVAHYETFATSASLAEARFFEFGAGWDMHTPLLMFAYGVNHQRVVDIDRHARLAPVADVVGRLPRLLDDAAAARVAAVNPQAADLDELLARFGVHYDAPADARATGLADASVDCVTSSSTMEHIPVDDLTAILDECRRILKPGGICSFFIDAGDHYTRFDRSIPTNNFLRYSPRQMRWINSRVFAQNRLRYPDYMTLIDKAGFDVLHDFHRDPGWNRALTRAEVAPEFRHYTDEELAISRIHLVVRPR